MVIKRNNSEQIVHMLSEPEVKLAVGGHFLGGG
jgi:hypothetical protein